MTAFLNNTDRIRKMTKMWAGMLCAFALSGCQSSDEMSMPQLTDANWNEVQGSITLNNEYLEGASAEFAAIPGTDSVSLKLSGVHPTEIIEMNVATTRTDEGDIAFEGKQFTKYTRELTVNGLYTRVSPDMGATAKSSVKIDIEYNVPIQNIHRTYYIDFNGDSGFRYIREAGTYPMAKVDIEGQRDSCEYISRIINTELAKNLRAFSLELGYNGQMTLTYTTSDSEKREQDFRYWMRTEKISGNYIFEVENPGLFYDCVFRAFNLTNTPLYQTQPYVAENDIASLYLWANDDYRDRKIIFLDDIHHNIFKYINNSFQEKGLWSIYDKRYIDLLYSCIHRAEDTPDNMAAFQMARWMLSNRGVNDK